MTTGSKRIARKSTVRGWLLTNGPASLHQIVAGTRLSNPAVSQALADIRNDPALEYATVATRGGGYTYKIADSVTEMKAGLINQARHMLTRAESMVTAGEKATSLAVTPDDFALAADVKANGRMLALQARSILTTMGV